MIDVMTDIHIQPWQRLSFVTEQWASRTELDKLLGITQETAKSNYNSMPLKFHKDQIIKDLHKLY